MILSIFLPTIAAFNIDRQIPSLLLSQKLHPISKLASTGNDNILDPLVFEKMFRERIAPIIIHTRVVRRDYVDDSGRKGSEEAMGKDYDNPESMFNNGSPGKYDNIYNNTDDNDYDMPAVREKGSKPQYRTHRMSGKDDEKTEKDLSKLKYYVPVVILIIIAGLAGFYFGKSAESRNYVRVPTNN